MTVSEIKEKIFPLPKRVEPLKGGGIAFGAGAAPGVSLEMPAPDEISRHAYELVRDRLSALAETAGAKGAGRGPAGQQSAGLQPADAQAAGATGAKTHASEPKQSGSEARVCLSIGEAPPGLPFPEQGYSIEIQNGLAKLVGFGPAGLRYAAETFVQLLRPVGGKVGLPALRLLDWPTMKTRGHMIETRYGSDLMEEADWKRMIDVFASHKLNTLQINVYNCWTVQYGGRVSEYLYIPIEGHPELKTPVSVKYFSPARGEWVEREQLPPMFERDFLGELMCYGKERGIAVYPGFSSFGHNTLIPANLPEISAKDESGEPALTGFCTSSEATYKFLFGVYDQIIDRYLKPHGIDAFSVGLDEVGAGIGQNAADIFKERSPWCKCERCRGKAPGALFVSHAIKVIKYLKSRGMKSVLMFGDMLVNESRYGIGQQTEALADAIKREGLADCAVIDWWSYADQPEKLMFQSTKPELGLRRVTKPWNGYYHWAMLTNPLRNIRLLAGMARDERAEGVMSYSSWDMSYDLNHHALAEYCWGFDEAGEPARVTERYAAQVFGAGHAESAREAFRIFDVITERRYSSFGEPAAIADYDMLFNVLSYYMYSYVRAGKPYPRAFPGEALSKVFEHRRDYEREMAKVAAMARRALCLFEGISEDSGCAGRALAGRYACEAANFLCLVEDYQALIDMADLAASEREDRIDRIRERAALRKNARLSLMRRTEEAKEHFLLAGILRNHSIFMQFFADVENYLAAAPPGGARLDFTDMGYLASDRFMSLR
jgi:hypothetical protein